LIASRIRVNIRSLVSGLRSIHEGSFLVLILSSNSQMHACSDTTSRVITAYVGETVHIQFSVQSLIHCQYSSRLDEFHHSNISQGNLRSDHFGGRLNISGSTLIISNVQTNDSGVYMCTEDVGLGKQHRIRRPLVVHGKLS